MNKFNFRKMIMDRTELLEGEIGKLQLQLDSLTDATPSILNYARKVARFAQDDASGLEISRANDKAARDTLESYCEDHGLEMPTYCDCRFIEA